jgi:DNA-directed RNA polymerase specialized sigma subunit
MRTTHKSRIKNYPFPVHEDDEDAILNMIVVKQLFPTLPSKQKVVLGLRLLGYTQVMISRLMNISRTSIGSLEKTAIHTLRKLILQDNV